MQVFRTYNASITLDRLLAEQEAAEAAAREAEREAHPKQPPESPTVDKRKADYDRANKEVRPLLGFWVQGFGLRRGLRRGRRLLLWLSHRSSRQRMPSLWDQRFWA